MSERPGPENRAVLVAAALIWREGRLLICQRKQSDAFPGKWEFPGGKIEPAESPPAALQRELLEELGIRARIGRQVAVISHQYEGRPPVQLHFHVVEEFEGIPENRAFEQILWVRSGELTHFDFLEADRPLIQRIVNGKLLPPRG